MPAPANDNFANSILIAGTFGQATVADNTDATIEVGEPVPTDSGAIEHSVWYHWVAPANGTATFNTAGSDDFVLAELDTVLAIYTGSVLASLVEVASNDDSGGLATSSCAFSVTGGVTYRIQVGAYDASKLGSYVLNWSLPVPPANDDWANAETITSSAGSADGTTYSATNDFPPTEFYSFANVWYSYTAPLSSQVTFTASDHWITVYTGAALASLVEANAGDAHAFETVTIPVASGTTYYVEVLQAVGESPLFSLSWTANEPVGVCIAFDDPTLEPNPTWTRLDNTSNLIASYSIDRGRQYELDETDVGRATIQVNDVDGILDPTNTDGPYYGKLEPLLQVAIALYNPVSETWKTLFRGYIEDFDYSLDQSQQVNRLTISAVDGLAILEAIEMTPGNFGDTLDPDVDAGNIMFVSTDVNVRIIQVLGNAGWSTDLQVIFSGNVVLRRSVYSPGETVLAVIRECAEAEFPGVANSYIDRLGRFTFHGRLARFDPAGTAAAADPGQWDWNHWHAGDGAAVEADMTNNTAQIRGMSFNRGLSKIINQATAAPAGIADDDIAGQLVIDSTSIGLYGIRSWSAPDLQLQSGILSGNNAKDEAKLYAQYYIDNYASPRNRITQLTFKSMRPDDVRATEDWQLLCNAEISDRIDVTVTHPGGGGFNLEPFFIEGVHYDVQPLNPTYQDVTLTLDVSPMAYFTSNPFPTS